MVKKINNEAVETEIVETSAAAETVAETPTGTVEPVIIPEPEVQAAPEAEVVAEVIPVEAEVVAETPKGLNIPVEGMVAVPQITTNGKVLVEQVVKTAKEEKKYKLILLPKDSKGNQRRIVVECMVQLFKDGKSEVSALEIAPLAHAKGLVSSTGVVTSVVWHLHQMSIHKPPYVICTNKETVTMVERPVTPAEATSISQVEFDALKATLAEVTAKLAAQTVNQ